MAVHSLLNVMRMQSEMTRDAVSQTRLGTISAYDPNNYAAKVIYQPDGVESGWLPIFSPWIGNGWGMFCPPTIGDQVKVHFQEGNFEAGMINLRAYNDVDRPLNVSSGEFWLVHKSGSFLKFHNDGSVELTTNTSLTATVGTNLTANVTGNMTANVQGNFTANITGTGSMSASGWSITGNMSVTGNITASGDITDHTRSMQGDRNIYNGHTHPDPQGSNTGTPNQPQ